MSIRDVIAIITEIIKLIREIVELHKAKKKPQSDNDNGAR